MTRHMPATAPKETDQIVAQLRQEFLTDARERLELIEQNFGTGGKLSPEALVTIRREVHNLKGMGGSFGFPVVSLIAHRLEDYISELNALDDRQVADLSVFLDHLQDIIEAGQEPSDGDTSDLLRGLPAHPGFQPDQVQVRNIEVLLVSPSKAVAQIAVKVLRDLGYRVTTVDSAWDAIEMAVRARPDLIITSAVMAGVSGIDLVRALRSMTVTEALPVAVLTSFSKDHQELQRLPGSVPVIRLGKTFDEDLAETITGLGVV